MPNPSTINHETLSPVEHLDLITLGQSEPSRPESSLLWSLLYEAFQPNKTNKYFPESTTTIRGKAYTCRYSLPTYLLYNEQGLELYDAITQLDEYYLFHKERAILMKYAVPLVQPILPHACILELGCGSLKKTALLLDALEQKSTPVHFYALDLDKQQLLNSLHQFQCHPTKKYKFVQFHGLLGTYEDGLAFLNNQKNTFSQLIVVWLGSSIGNLSREEAILFLQNLHQVLNQPQDALVLGIDKRNDPEITRLAYNDPKGVTRSFSMNLFSHLESILSSESPLKEKYFEFFPYYNEEKGRNECYYRCTRPHQFTLHNGAESIQVEMAENELIHIEFSYKYSTSELHTLLRSTGFHCIHHFEDNDHMFRLLWLQSPFSSSFQINLPPLKPNAPYQQLARQIQSAWWDALKIWDWLFDVVLRTEKVLLSRPIALRHPFLFYMGHLSCFADIQLSKAFGLPLAPPMLYSKIFERGIDPIVDHPEICHSHSEIPETWPDITEIRAYRQTIRYKIEQLVQHHTWELSHISALSMAYEHDLMHLETLFYMIWQTDPTLLHTSHPLIQLNQQEPHQDLPPAHWVAFKSCTIPMGTQEEFSWDLEKPERMIEVKAFEIQSRPVSNLEWYQYIMKKEPKDRMDLLPSTWQWHAPDKVFVRQFSQYVPLHQQASHPVLVTLDMANQYAKDANARLPSESELVYLYHHTSPTSKQATCNYGFVRFNTCPMGTYENRPGNAWEWTSTLLNSHTGFQPDPRYPGYSADFFDGLHYVCLGASWATHASLVTRKSFRNWFQKNYPYAFVTFRLCRSC
ncbi:hypothetical protein HMI54_006738 [Coelomomyces lativittatus]|nr:hypothetical protein HMI56_002705 [Coelomomyces lativittatus]KAJ1504664.1 hypothetical protein HMI54_006738 [Coelomomyces lativittatus]